MKILEQLEKQKKSLRKRLPRKKNASRSTRMRNCPLVRQYHKNKYTEFETEGLKLEVNSMLGELVSARRETM